MGDECGAKPLYYIDERAGSEMVELPKDADGIPIHVSDTVHFLVSGVATVVRELRLTDRWILLTDDGLKTETWAVTHKEIDSWERIAHDLETFYGLHHFVSKDDMYEFADRIRKLAEKESK